MGDAANRTVRELDAAEQSQIVIEMKEVLMSLQLLADERLATHRISFKQGLPLKYLNRPRSWNVTELAAAVGTAAGAMTRMLERLEAKGLLERRRRPSVDRRVVDVILLEPGVAVAAKVDGVLAHAAEDHLKGFSSEECTQLRELLGRMRANGLASHRR